MLFTFFQQGFQTIIVKELEITLFTIKIIYYAAQVNEKIITKYLQIPCQILMLEFYNF